MAKAAAAPKAAPAKKASKKAKDTGAPKRPLSAYMFMSQDWRERIKAANPDASFGEVGRLLGAKWQEMNDAQKKPYVDMAERDKLRAAKEKADYVRGLRD
ncbi:HMG-box [Tilletiopsis washingtonensis]|uniref:HMG-box n=1 Tax=Tilletiopsis washingtonensis TaxID=58919 RepID=A0A316ZDT8_9BASI|nr:HMG-box [Tilletiopsis washingtonensis]PWN99691.1 HMG-box [Tilletiopsis washingtonensis]